MAKIIEQEEQGGINMIASGTTLNGDISTSGDCRIDGTLKGTMTSNAKVVVGANGSIEGKIKCRSIEIEGFVKADIETTELLCLKASANLVGNINVGKISIEALASFVGNCTMNNSQPE